MKALPPETVRLLSSSQVITSVVSVVKELMENSLDAGASGLEIKLDNYGLDRIEVRDNGSGISASDTPVMAVRHYTSKISRHEDLQQLHTYGFRGEALGSICSVSEVVITTKTAEDDLSTQYTLDPNGLVVSQKPSHLGQGTTVCALNLFRNLPVRRQYYSNTKKCKEELKKVQDLLMAYAVIKPELRIVLSHNRVVVWRKARESDHGAALMAVLGASTAANLLPVHHRQEQAEIVIDGFFPKPNSDLKSTSSSSSDKTFIFVNKRPVNHKDILKLIKQYYSNAAQSDDEFSSRRFPVLMMNITVPTSSVDVNLTPDKMQVLLQNKDAVLLAVEAVLISLYGSYTVGTENHRAVESQAGVNLPAGENQPGRGKAPNECPLPSPKSKDGDTSLPSTANTSSSSSSQDWVINTSLSDSDAFAENGAEPHMVQNPTADPERSSPKAATGQQDHPTAESWSMGKAFTEPSSGEYLQPVKLHLPEPDEQPDAGKTSPSKRPTNVIVEKTAKLTAYDLISSRSVRQPLSAFALFEQDSRSSILQEKRGAGAQDVTAAVEEKWESLGEEERGKYEEKARQSLDVYNEIKKRASGGSASDQTEPCDHKGDATAHRTRGLKRKAPVAINQTLDKLFSSKPENKRNRVKACKPLEFSMAALRRELQRQPHPDTRALRLVKRLVPHAAWVVVSGRKLMLLNPFRLEETLLFKRLLENNILPVVKLQPPVLLTDGGLGGAEYMEVLMKMEKGRPSLTGEVQFTDARLVANGFQIRLTPGSSSTGTCAEVTAMADCMPFYGIADLREVLTAVKDRNAGTVLQCRPLKVTSYLEGEAVRMARQLPLNMDVEDVRNMLTRMSKDLDKTCDLCLHGRPFLHHLADVPESDQEQ